MVLLISSYDPYVHMVSAHWGPTKTFVASGTEAKGEEAPGHRLFASSGLDALPASEETSAASIAYLKVQDSYNYAITVAVR